MHPGPINLPRIGAALSRLASGPAPATAIITGNVSTTIAVIRLLGADFGATALVGFDDFPLADLLTPGVSVIAQDPAQLGREAASLLFARLDGYEGAARHTIVPTRYIARGSGEIPAPAG